MTKMTDKDLAGKLKAIRLRTSSELDTRVRGLWQRAGAEFETARARTRPRHWPVLARIIAPATVACLLGVVAWWLLSGQEPMSSAYAELAEAVEKSQATEWVHMRGMVGGEDTEMWLSLHPLRAFVRRGDRVQAADETAHGVYEYEPATRTVTIKYMAKAPPEASQAKNYLAVFMSGIERAEKEGVMHISASEEVVAGKTYVVYTLTATQEGFEARVTVDTSTQRIVRMEGEASQGPCGAGPFAIEFDYPETGPADIYALGVPRDAKVVDETPSRDVIELRQSITEARERFAPTYYAVIWRGSASADGRRSLHHLEVVYKKDGRYRVELYRPFEPAEIEKVDFGKLSELTPPDDMAALEAWVRTRPVYDLYFRAAGRGAEATRIWREGSADVRRERWSDDMLQYSVEGRTWGRPPSVKVATGLPPKDGLWGRLIGAEHTSQGRVRNGDIVNFPTRTRRYWNPQRDYALEETEHFLDVNAPWQEDEDWLKDADPELAKQQWRLDLSDANGYAFTSTERVVEYTQTRQGQWYAKKTLREGTTLAGTPSRSMVVIHLDAERDIPDELLDPDSVTVEIFKLPPAPPK